MAFINVTREEFQTALASFSTKVKNKIYEPIPYNEWKWINKTVKETGFVAIYSLPDSSLCHADWDIAGEPARYYPDKTNKSLGAFLFNFYFKKEPIMGNTTLNCNPLNCCSTGDIAYSNTNYTGVNTTNDYYTYATLNLNEGENKKEEKKEMKFLNFDFGFITDNDSIRMSPYGMAVKNQNGTYVAYHDSEIIDVDVFNFKAEKMYMKVPVAIDQIATGDILVHNRKPCYVVGFAEDTGNPMVIDIFMGERKEILPQKSPFGFNFVTKIISLLDGFNMNMTADAANPFGNMWMLMLMNDGKMDDILPFVMMSQTGNGNMNAFGNSMLMYMLMKDNKDSDLLPLMLMMGQQKK